MYIYSLGLYVMPLAFLIRSFCFLSCSAIMWCMALATTKECNMCWFAFRFSFNSYVFVLHHPMPFFGFSRSVELSLPLAFARLFFFLSPPPPSLSTLRSISIEHCYALSSLKTIWCTIGMVSALYFYVKSSFFLDMFVAKNQNTKTKPNRAKPSQMEHNRNERIEELLASLKWCTEQIRNRIIESHRRSALGWWKQNNKKKKKKDERERETKEKNIAPQHNTQ